VVVSFSVAGVRWQVPELRVGPLSSTNLAAYLAWALLPSTTWDAVLPFLTLNQVVGVFFLGSRMSMDLEGWKETAYDVC